MLGGTTRSEKVLITKATLKIGPTVKRIRVNIYLPQNNGRKPSLVYRKYVHGKQNHQTGIQLYFLLR